MAQTVLTAAGFKRKRYADYIAEMEEAARGLWGADVDLSDNGPLGKFIKLQAYSMAEENELTEKVYYSAFIDYVDSTAAAAKVGKNIGIAPFAAAKASGTNGKGNAPVFTVTPGATVAAGTIIATAGNVQFKTLVAATDTARAGTIAADVEAVNIGPLGNVPAGSVTVIKTPAAGVLSVTNPQPFTGGRLEETPSEFQTRYKKSTSKGGSSTTDSVLAELLDTKDIRAAIVNENDTDQAFPNGQPPHSLAPVVLGGAPEDIGAAILRSKAGGIQSWGSRTVTAYDKSGRPKTIGFSYATEKYISVKIDLTRNSVFPTNGGDLVELAVIKYIGGTDKDGVSYAGIGMGEDVIYGQLYWSVFSIPGIATATVQVSTDGGVTWTAGDVAVPAAEVAQTDAAKVAVNIA